MAFRNRQNIIFYATYHLILLMGLPLYFWFITPSANLIIIAGVLFVLTQVSVTAGYHRLYAHSTYKTNKAVEAILLFFSAMAAQSTALRWSSLHRIHHSHTDQKKDPYNITKGFWHAHITWLFTTPMVYDPKLVPDLMKNKLVLFQDKYYHKLFLTSNIITSLLIGWWLEDFIGAFLLAWGIRMFLCHHFTFFVNSLAHMWGSRSYTRELSAVDNFMVSLLTFGEGYHNYHHAFARDYRNGIRWYHFDPTKWLIWALTKLGLAWDAKKVNPFLIKQRLVLEDKKLLLEELQTRKTEDRRKFEEMIHGLVERFTANVSKISQLYRQYEVTAREHPASKAIRAEIRQLKRHIHDDWRTWLALTHTIIGRKSKYA